MQNDSMLLKSLVSREMLVTLFSRAVPAFPGQTKTLETDLNKNGVMRFNLNSPENIMLNTTLAKIALGGAKFEMKWGNLTAGSIISFIPIIIIYSILQRYFIRGITGSAVKE